MLMFMGKEKSVNALFFLCRKTRKPEEAEEAFLNGETDHHNNACGECFLRVCVVVDLSERCFAIQIFFHPCTPVILLDPLLHFTLTFGVLFCNYTPIKGIC